MITKMAKDNAKESEKKTLKSRHRKQKPPVLFATEFLKYCYIIWNNILTEEIYY